MKNNKSTHEYRYSFPAIRGVQAGREYYVTMCPLKLLTTIFSNKEDLPSALQVQREVNKDRIPLITRYVLAHPDNYVFSAIAASINGEVTFEACGADVVGQKIGTLSVPMDAQFVIIDGQHRLAAISEVLRENPLLEYETISMVLFVDVGLKRSQQMFADLNRCAVRPTKYSGVLYDKRDPMARLTNKLIDEIPVFKAMTEMAKSSISNRSRKLFTMSSIYQATRRLLQKQDGEAISAGEEKLAFKFWEEVIGNMSDWLDAANRKIPPSELRRNYIHAHGFALQALAIAGNRLTKLYPNDWQQRLVKIQTMDWQRSNKKLWEGKALVGGRLNKSRQHLILTANVINKILGLPLDSDEGAIEPVSNIIKP